MSPAAQTRQHAMPWRNKMISSSKSMTYLFFCSTCQRTQPRRHSCDPILKQPKDRDYAAAVYDRILCPGWCRTCNRPEEHQEKSFPCAMCNNMLPEAKSGQRRLKDRLTTNIRCIDCRSPNKVLFPCKVCKRMLPKAEYDDAQWKRCLEQNATCKGCR